MPKRYKILITGSSGMLGIDLSRELAGDYEIYGLDVVPNTHDYVADFRVCDITDKKKTLKALALLGPDIVIHAAAWTDVDGCEGDKKKAYRINGIGTQNIALACKMNAALLIYLSTDFVFDGKKKNPYTEKDKPHSLSIYGDSKLKGELSIKKILKKYFILRTGWLYGKDGSNFVDTIRKKAKTEKVLRVVKDQKGSPTYTKDLVKAIHALLGNVMSGSGIYHVSNSGSVSWYEYAKAILKLSGLKTEVVPITAKELNRPAKRPAMSVLDNSKFIKFTGYRMRHWEEALKDYLR